MLVTAFAISSLLVVAAAKRRAVGDINVTPQKGMRRSQLTFKIVKCAADIEIIFLEKNPGTDAYSHNLQTAVNEDGYLKGEGVLFAVRRRRGVDDNEVMLNQTDRYPRRVFVRAVDESTHTSRLAILTVMQAYMLRPENNRYNAEYIVNDNSDLTDEHNLETVDHYLQDSVIVDTIIGMYEDTDDTWFASNRGLARRFFSGPIYPRIAIETLGFVNADDNADNGGAFHENFHDVDAPDQAA